MGRKNTLTVLERLELGALMRAHCELQAMLGNFPHERMLYLAERAVSAESEEEMRESLTDLETDNTMRDGHRLVADIKTLQEATEALSVGARGCDCARCRERRLQVERRRQEDIASQKGSVH
jgi:hypothetical protein